MSFSEWRKNRPRQDENQVGAFLEDWKEALKGGPVTVITNSDEKFQKELPDQLQKVDNFGIVLRGQSKFKIRDKKIAVFEISESCIIELQNCIVTDLSLSNREAKSSLVLRNCWVGRLNFNDGQLNFLEIKGGGIDRVLAPLPSERSPFRGSVSIRGVWLSPDFENAQAYRNLRHHLASMRNHDAASVFHAAEMRTLLSEQNLFERFANVIYRCASNYGDSTTRPLMWFLFFTLASFLILFEADGAITIVDASERLGWRKELEGSTTSASALRAGLLTLTQILNPLGIFGAKGLVVAKTTSLAALNTALALGATAALGFLVFSLGRRFRIKGDAG